MIPELRMVPEPAADASSANAGFENIADIIRMQAITNGNNDSILLFANPIPVTYASKNRFMIAETE